MSDTAQTPQTASATSAQTGQAGQATDAATATPSAAGTKTLQPLATPEPQAGSCCGSGGCH